MSGHTPGPWAVGEERHGYDCIVRGPKNEPIASTQMAGYTKREARLNATLIAAAPTLLSALKDCEAAFQAWVEAAEGSEALTNGELARMTNAVWTNCKVVLAMAEGKSP